MSSKVRFKTDYYVPNKNPSERLKIWMRNMRTLASQNVKEKLVERYNKGGGYSPFEVFIVSNRIDLDFLCELEYLKLTRRHFYEIETINSKVEAYNERLEE